MADEVVDVDETKPFNNATKLYLHEWGLDYKIEENERRFAQAEVHDEGKPIDVAKVLKEAGVNPPPEPVNPQLPGVTVAEDAEEPFDEEAVRAELNTWHVPELKAELKERGLDEDGKKDELVDRLVEAMKAE